MTALAGGLTWVVSTIPIWAKVLACIGIFMIIYALILQIVSRVRRQDIPNRIQLLNAIAKYETSSRDYFRNLDQTAEQQQVQTGRDLQEQLLVSGLSSKRDNPISILYNFVGVQLLLKLGAPTNRPDMLLDELGFAVRLRDKTKRAMAWVRAITK